MADYAFTRKAERDLTDIWHGITQHNPVAADALLRRLFRRIALAAEHPASGAARPDIGAAARIFVEGRYIIIYERASFGILVIAVVHGARDPLHWLD